jgi:predicted ATPase
MLTEFTLANFKSYRNSRLPLGSLTLLIGANAAGKSNVLEGLRFLSWLAQGQKLSSIQYAVNGADQIVRGRVDDLCYRGESSFRIGCCLDLTEFNKLDIAISVLNGDMEISEEHIVNSDGFALYATYSSISPVAKTRYSDEETDVLFLSNFDDALMNFTRRSSYQRALFTQLDIEPFNPNGMIYDDAKNIQQRIIETVCVYQQVLQNILFLDPVPTKMREYSFKSDRKLQEDGTNLSSVLFRLWENQPENQRIILNFIQSLPEQAIDDLYFLIGPRDEVMVSLSETFGHTRQNYEAALLSDGTLRVLAIAAALLSATEGGLIVIEEIDNGVHPSRVKSLITSIQEIAKRRNLQVLISTHNPALMDAIPDSALGDVVFCYRDTSMGDSRLIRLGDLDEFPGLISQGSLGQLVTKGVVDRFIKSPHTPEDRRQQAMDWLKQLQEYGDE